MTVRAATTNEEGGRQSMALLTRAAMWAQRGWKRNSVMTQAHAMSSVRLGMGWGAYYFNVIGKAGYGLGCVLFQCHR
jgi:hypothetical protein